MYRVEKLILLIWILKFNEIFEKVLNLLDLNFYLDSLVVYEDWKFFTYLHSWLNSLWSCRQMVCVWVTGCSESLALLAVPILLRVTTRCLSMTNPWTIELRRKLIEAKRKRIFVDFYNCRMLAIPSKARSWSILSFEFPFKLLQKKILCQSDSFQTIKLSKPTVFQSLIRWKLLFGLLSINCCQGCWWKENSFKYVEIIWKYFAKLTVVRSLFEWNSPESHRFGFLQNPWNRFSY